jgi:hypothetical protein
VFHPLVTVHRDEPVAASNVTQSSGVTSGIVFQPRLDQEALADPATAALFEHQASRVRQAPVVLAVLTGSGLVVGLRFVAPPSPSLDVLAGLAFVLAGLMIDAAVLGPGPRAWGWPRVRPLLARQPWRQTGALVLAARGTLLRLADGTVARVWDVRPPVRDVIARTGRVWVIGPDEAGWLALRVDGFHTPFPARVTRGSAPVASPAPTSLPDHLARVQRTSLLRWLVGVVVGGVLVVLAPVFGAVAVAGCLGMAALRGYLAREVRRFAGIDSWQRLEVTVAPWESTRNGLATTTVTTPSGPLVLPAADLNVLANAMRSGVIWVAPGVAGYPDFPLLARTK